MIGKIGFRLPEKAVLPDDLKQKTERGEVEYEVIQPTLFVTLDCLTNDPYACFSLMLVLQSFGFEPAGPNMERYQFHDKLHYQWMIPVVHGEKSESYSSDLFSSEIGPVLIRITRTGCYETFQGYLDYDQDGFGKTTSVFRRLMNSIAEQA